MDKKAYLGIDVSKGYADFLLLDADQQVIEKPFQLADNKEGRLQLKKLIAAWNKMGIKALYCGLESTGGYENNWYEILRQLSVKKNGTIHVSRLNPKAVKSVGQASLKRTITDAVSAHTIALYLIKFSEKVDYGAQSNPEQEASKHGRQHYTCIRMLQKQKVQLNNQLEKLLYQYFSEILVYCRHGIPLWLLELLRKYPTAAKVTKAGEIRLMKIKGIGQERATGILLKAKQSDGNSSDHINHLISITAAEILHKELLIKEEKSYLKDIYGKTNDVLLLCTIPGIGVDSAINIMLEIEDINRFSTAKKLSAYFGISPVFKQSGDGLWGAHMSKQGRCEIRTVLFMAILAGLKFNPVLKDIYERFRLKGMNHKQAAGVIMHKLLRIVFGVLKSQTPFNAAVDAGYQDKTKVKEQQSPQQVSETPSVKEASTNRFKPSFINAPISRRNDRKRKNLLKDPT